MRIRTFCFVSLVLFCHGASLREGSDKTIQRIIIVTSAQNTLTAVILLQSRLVSDCLWKFSVKLNVVYNKWIWRRLELKENST